MVEHLLRVVVSVDGRLDAQVAEHGVGFLSAEELDGVGVHTGTEQGCRAARAERAGTDELGGDASGVLEGLG